MNEIIWEEIGNLYLIKNFEDGKIYVCVKGNLAIGNKGETNFLCLGVFDLEKGKVLTLENEDLFGNKKSSITTKVLLNER